MDTIRTVYLDSAHSVERNGSYVYDLQGGIAVPEGARVYVDNVSFTNTFSEEVTENTNDIPESLRFYIDYDRMARDMELSGDIFTIETGFEEVHVFGCH